ncbi:NUDIX hydrolase [Roseibium denhamense]|uniref:NUDIX hydrolase n=1 Tax=Roseibium denhamense TaxID=76305 RepID=UPI0012BD80AE|nr:NUDIX hydrolase [Roseibium denhamense]MTI08072.1 NUDIX hydrolase [Roseibium denhamense]
MAMASAIKAFDASLREFAGLFIKPARLQIAALCFRPGEDEPEVLLVSSRDTGRWILPKGWPEKGQPAFETALTEAREEAGVLGTATPKALGSFRSFKGLSSGLRLRTNVLVFKVRFDEQLQEFKEAGQRKCVWLPLSQAAAMADEPALGRFLLRYRSDLI